VIPFDDGGAPHPFKIIDEGGLNLSVREGMVFGLTADMQGNGWYESIPVSGNSLPVASLGTTAAADDDYTYIYLDIAYTQNAHPAIDIPANHWMIFLSTSSAAEITVETGYPSAPGYFDYEAATPRFRVLIGYIETSGGDIVGIKNYIKDHWQDKISGAMWYAPP
jgi:hypothetical protein